VDAEDSAINVFAAVYSTANAPEELRKRVRWTGRRNLFIGPQTPCVRWGDHGQSSQNGIQQWNAFWSGAESGSIGNDLMRFTWEGVPESREMREDPHRWALTGNVEMDGVVMPRSRFGADIASLPPLQKQ
jgi:hypothetical protein